MCNEVQAVSEKECDHTNVDREVYSEHVRQVMEAADWPWPDHVLLERSKMPRFVHSVEEFMRELHVGCHMDEIIVFPDGLEKLGHQNALGADIASATGYKCATLPPKARTGYEVLENLAEAGTLERFKGKATYRRSLEDRKDVAAGGRSNGNLVAKWEDLKEQCPDDAKESVYLAEMRLLQSQPHNDGLRTKRKSTMAVTMRERMHRLGLDVRSMPFWDDFSEGLFCGAGCSSYDLHVDCIPSSNVGSVFAGHKLLAIWGWPNDTRRIMKRHAREHFAKPLTAAQVAGLESACRVALAPPGSVYIFSGCNAHAVCNVGFGQPGPNCVPNRSLIISSYEAFVNLHVAHLRALTDTCDGKCGCNEESDSEDEDLLEFQDDVAEGVCEMQKRLSNNEIQEPEAAAVALVFLRQRLPRIDRSLEEHEIKMKGQLQGRSPESKRRKRNCGSDGGSSSQRSSPCE